MLELKLSKKENEIEKLNRKIEDKDIDIKNLKEKQKEFQKKITESEDKVKQIGVEMKGYKEQLSNYEQDNIGLKKEITTLNTNYNRLKDDNKDLSSMVDKLREQLESKRDSFKNASKIDEDEFEEYKHATETLIADYKNQINDFEKKIEDVIADNDQLIQEKEEENEELMNKLKSANSKIESFQQIELTYKSTLSELEKRVDELVQDKIVKERNGLDSYSELLGNLKAMEIKYNQTNSKLVDREEKLKSLESKITVIEEEKIYMMSHEEQKRDELRDEYRVEIEELKDKIVELENQNDQILIEKDMLQQKLNKELNSNQSSDDLIRDYQRVLSQAKKLQEQISEKDSIILELQNSTSGSGDKKKNTFKRSGTNKPNDNRDRELAELTVENEFLNKQVEELNARIRELENSGRISSFSSNEGIYGNMKEGHEDPSKMFSEMKQEISTVTTELIKIKQQYAESELERNSLSLKLKEKNEYLKKFSLEITKYELEMVKAKQSLAEILNQNIEVEQYNAQLVDEIDRLKQNMTKHDDKVPK